MKWFRCLTVLAVATLAGVRCYEAPSAPDTPNPAGSTMPALIVSEPIAPAVVHAAGMAGSAIAVVFVSLPPGTLANAVSVRIRNLTTGGEVTPPVPILGGGFDPVAVPASAGDRLELEFTDGIGRVTHEFATIPIKRPPVVVRTSPSEGRTDVALSVRPVVVFSEPIDPATLTVGMRLLTGGTLVNGRIELLEPWLAAFVPASPLEPGTTYELELSQEIRGADGVALGAPLSPEFTTEPSGPAASGAIAISIDASGPGVNGLFRVTLDGTEPFYVPPGGPHYMTDMSAGEHVVSLIGPANCLVETGPLSVTVTVGSLARDTVEVTFSVTCGLPVGGVRITAPTTGLMPGTAHYRVMYEHYGYWDYGSASTELGTLDPNGSLFAELTVSGALGSHLYWYIFYLRDVPANCYVQSPYPNPLVGGVVITFGDTLDLEFQVDCSP